MFCFHGKRTFLYVSPSCTYLEIWDKAICMLNCSGCYSVDLQSPGVNIYTIRSMLELSVYAHSCQSVVLLSFYDLKTWNNKYFSELNSEHSQQKTLNSIRMENLQELVLVSTLCWYLYVPSDESGMQRTFNTYLVDEFISGLADGSDNEAREISARKAVNSWHMTILWKRKKKYAILTLFSLPSVAQPVPWGNLVV